MLVFLHISTFTYDDIVVLKRSQIAIFYNIIDVSYEIICEIYDL